MTDRLRAGIIGTGFIGTVHAHAVRASGATVATVAASTPRSAIEAAERLGAAAAEGPLHRVGRVSNVLKHHAVASWLQIGSTKVAMDDSNVAIRLKGLPPMKLGYHSITWGRGVVGDPSGVTSIKDLYYRSPGSMEQAITDIAAAGYAGTEMFDGNLADFAATPEVLTESLYNSGLELISVYTGANFIYSDVLPDELYRINRAAELAVMFGARRLVVGGGARRAAGTTNEDYTLLGAGLDRVVDIAEQHGLAASYHPHLGTIAESPDEIERVFTSSRIAFCPDTAHLAAGGGDPAALIRAHSDRIAHVHLKDLTTAPFAFQPLGQGDLDFDEILSAVREVGYDDWLVVELDTYDGDPKTAAEISKKFLETRLG